MLNQSEVYQKIVTQTPGHALEQALYCDAGTYEADLAQIFYREWILAAPSCAVGRPGDYITLQLGDYPVVVVRGRDHAIRAFHNVCRHRGQRLCARPAGRKPNFVCPYHQWTYDLEGRLIAARDMGENFDPRRHGLKPVHCADLGGIIYICVAQTAPDIKTLSEVAQAYLAPSGLHEAKIAHSATIMEQGNWKLVMENNRECYHCGGAHPSLCRTYSDNPTMTAIAGPDAAAPEILDHWQRCEAAGLPSRLALAPDYQWRLTRIPLLNNAESFTLDTKAAVGRPMGRMPFNDAGSLLMYHYPNTWNHFLADHAIVFRILPVSPTQTEVTTYWLVHKDAVEGEDYDIKTLTEVWQATNDEDRAVVEENQKGIQSPAYSPGPYSPVHEEGVIQFTNWYRHLMEQRLAPETGDRHLSVRENDPMGS